MTKKKAFEVTRDFWKWESKQNEKVDKEDWGRFDELEELDQECAFCGYFRCDDCPLGEQLGVCYDPSSHFVRWLSSTIPQQKAAARKIYEFTDQYIKDNFK